MCEAIKYLYIFGRGHTHATLNHIIEMSTHLVRIPTIVSDRKSGQRGSPGLRQQTSLSSVHLSCQLVPFQLHSKPFAFARTSLPTKNVGAEPALHF